MRTIPSQALRPGFDRASFAFSAEEWIAPDRGRGATDDRPGGRRISRRRAPEDASRAKPRLGERRPRMPPNLAEGPIEVSLFPGVVRRHEFCLLACPAPDAAIGGELSAFFETQNGDLWIGAEHGTAHYDGKKWREFNAGDKASPDSPVAFLELADGKTWCATVDKIWQFDERDWSEVRSGFDRINGMITLAARAACGWRRTEACTG